jgi:predicted RNA binding protein YcfA (HicA-like mRNA interferase family)
MEKKFTITKKIAKHGKQSVIIIPSALKEQIKPKTLAKITIDILEEK